MERRGEDNEDIEKLIQTLLKVFSRTTDINEEKPSEIEKLRSPTDNEEEISENADKRKGKGKRARGKAIIVNVRLNTK